jgi:hypothetical protein
MGNHKRAMKKVHPYVAAVIKAMLDEGDVKKKKSFGKELLVFLVSYTSDYQSSLDSLEVEFDGDKPAFCNEQPEEQAFQDYCRELRRDKKNLLEQKFLIGGLG